MKRIKEWLQARPWLRRALRTFLQTALGVLAAALAEHTGALEGAELEAALLLAVATGLAAVMNLGEKPTQKEASGDDGSEPAGV